MIRPEGPDLPGPFPCALPAVRRMLEAVRVVVTGASGNVGTAVLDWLTAHPAIESVAAIARHLPSSSDRCAFPAVTWHRADIAEPDAADRLSEIFADAHEVVHLAWRINTGHDRRGQERTNRDGSAAVVEAMRRTGVGHLTFLSSAAVYSPAPVGARLGENWPRQGIAGSAYSSDKVAVEDMLDRAETDVPGLSIARIRPPTVLQAAAAQELTRIALGRLAPLLRLTGGRLPVLPLPSHAQTQVVSAQDVADLVGRAVLARARGAYNVADDPILAPAELARLLGGRHVPTPAPLAYAVLDFTFRLHLQPLHPSWLDVLLRIPLLDCAKARIELGWRANHDARAVLGQMREAVRKSVGAHAPPL